MDFSKIGSLQGTMTKTPNDKKQRGRMNFNNIGQGQTAGFKLAGLDQSTYEQNLRDASLPKPELSSPQDIKSEDNNLLKMIGSFISSGVNKLGQTDFGKYGKSLKATSDSSFYDASRSIGLGLEDFGKGMVADSEDDIMAQMLRKYFKISKDKKIYTMFDALGVNAIKSMLGHTLQDMGKAFTNDMEEAKKNFVNEQDIDPFLAQPMVDPKTNQVNWNLLMHPSYLLSKGTDIFSGLAPILASGGIGEGSAAVTTTMALMAKGSSFEDYTQTMAAKQGIDVKDLSVADVQRADELSTINGLANGILMSKPIMGLMDAVGGKTVAKSIFRKSIFEMSQESMKTVAKTNGIFALLTYLNNGLVKYGGIDPDRDLTAGLKESQLEATFIAIPTVAGSIRNNRAIPMEGKMTKDLHKKIQEEKIKKFNEVQKKVELEHKDKEMSREEIANKIVGLDKMLEQPEIQNDPQLKTRAENEILRLNELMKTAKEEKPSTTEVKPEEKKLDTTKVNPEKKEAKYRISEKTAKDRARAQESIDIMRDSVISGLETKVKELRKKHGATPDEQIKILDDLAISEDILSSVKKKSGNIKDSSYTNKLQTELQNLKAEGYLKKYRETTGVPVGKMSKENVSEIKKLNKKIFGDENIGIVEKVTTKEGREALGVYKDTMIKIADNKIEGKRTFYHEAFHKSYDMFLTTKERAKLMEAAKKKYGEKDKAILEEKLSDGLMEMATKKRGLPSDIWTKKISDIFKILKERIKQYFSGEHHINKTYKDILEGKLKKRIGEPSLRLSPAKFREKVLKTFEGKSGNFNYRALYRDLYEKEYGTKPKNFPKFVEEASKKDAPFVGSVIKQARKIGKKIVLEKKNKAITTKHLKKRITTELKSTKLKKQSGKIIGRFGKKQKILDRMREVSKMTRKDAIARIDKNIIEMSKNEPTLEKSIENELLNMVGGVKEMKDPVKLKKLLGDIKGLKEHGRIPENLKKFNLETKFQRIREKLIAVNSGGEGLPSGIKTVGAVEQVPKGFKGKVVKALSVFDVISGWSDILDTLSLRDKKSKPGESFISKWGNVTKQENMSRVGNMINTEKTRQMVKEAFGLKTDREIRTKFRADSKKIKLGEFVNADGNTVTLEFSVAEARKRWMEFQDPTLRESFDKGMGYTKEIRNAITKILSPADIKFAKLQLDFYKEYYKGVNDMYHEMYGVDLPFNNHYSPIKREDITRDSANGFGEFMQEIGIRRSIAPGGTKARVKNIKRIAERKDTAVLDQHIAQMEHFKAWATKSRELNAVFGNAEVRNSIKINNGKMTLMIIDHFMRRFTRGGIETADRLNILDKTRIKIARSVLAAKGAIGIKQMVSFMAYAEKVPVADFAKYETDFFLNPIKNTKFLYDNMAYLKDRGSNINRDVRTMMKSDAFANYTKNPSFLNKLMLMMEMGDQGAIVLGGHAFYKHKMKVHGNHTRAIRELTDFTKTTQQSGDMSDKSMVQGMGSFADLFTMFHSSQNQYFRKELMVAKNSLSERGSGKQHLKTIAIYHFVLPQLFQLVVNRFQWDKDEQARAAILGSLNGIFIVTDMLESAIRAARGMHVWDPSTPIDMVATEGAKVMTLLHKLMTDKDEITTKDVLTATRAAGSLTGVATGVPVKQGIDMIAGVKMLSEGEAEGAWKIAGWSENTKPKETIISKKKKKKKIKKKTLIKKKK